MIAAAVTDHDVARALALADIGTLLLIVTIIGLAVMYLWPRHDDELLDGSDWEPEPPRVVAQRSVFDQDCQHLARTRGGDGWRHRCLDCGADLGE